MLLFTNILTFLILTVWIGTAVFKLIKRENYSIYFVSIVFYVFFVLPLFFDAFVSKPKYDFYPGFIKATNDQLTAYIYCIYLLIIAFIWSVTGKVKKPKKVKAINFSTKMKNLIKKAIIPLCYMGLLSPLVSWIFAPEPSFYNSYGAVIVENMNDNIASYHSLINLSALLCIISSTVLLLVRKHYFIQYFLFLVPFMSVAVWLHGKRNIVAMTIFLLVYVFWSKGLFKGKKLFFAGVTAVVILSLYSNVYQENLRYNQQFSIIDTDQEYENFRVDYGRDDVTKMTIYAELNPEEMKILEYRGQSFFFYATLPIPRDYWQEKPWPYAVYFTSAIFGIPPTFLGWGMTTSILEEAISNFSWLGMLIGPLLISLLCWIGDSKENIIVRALTTLIACLMLVVELTAFMPLFYMWLFMVFGISILNKLRI